MNFYKFSHGGASAKLHASSGNTYVLTNVWSNRRGQGHATELLKTIVEFADTQNIRIELVAQQYGGRSEKFLNDDQLAAFYSKFGFFRDMSKKRPIFMVREPVRN